MDKNLKFGIIGLGLIGGSIFKALCALKCCVFGVSASQSTIEQALEYSPNVSTELETLAECDVVFVCTPMHLTLSILDKLEKIVSKNAIVTDVCSLKSFVSVKKRPYIFIPSHPMAGTEFSGFMNAFESLFQGAKWVLTPFDDTPEKELKKLKGITQVLGAVPVITTAKEHDEAVALISHMPMLLSQALFKTAEVNDLALKLASSGFRDMTRLALSNETMANDMINMNSQNIQQALLKLYSSIGELLGGDYQAQIAQIKTERKNMYREGVNVL